MQIGILVDSNLYVLLSAYRKQVWALIVDFIFYLITHMLGLVLYVL